METLGVIRGNSYLFPDIWRGKTFTDFLRKNEVYDFDISEICMEGEEIPAEWQERQF